jgi:hypothetical protein
MCMWKGRNLLVVIFTKHRSKPLIQFSIFLLNKRTSGEDEALEMNMTLANIN